MAVGDGTCDLSWPDVKTTTPAANLTHIAVNSLKPQIPETERTCPESLYSGTPQLPDRRLSVRRSSSEPPHCQGEQYIVSDWFSPQPSHYTYIGQDCQPSSHEDWFLSSQEQRGAVIDPQDLSTFPGLFQHDPCIHVYPDLHPDQNFECPDIHEVNCRQTSDLTSFQHQDVFYSPTPELETDSYSSDNFGVNPTDSSPSSMDDVAPGLSYAKLLEQCLRAADNYELTLQEIYEWFRQNTSKCGARDEKEWQNSIRHNLSMNPYFVKGSRTAPDSLKRNMWSLSEDAIQGVAVEPTTRFRDKPQPWRKCKGQSRKKPSRSQRSASRSGRITRQTVRKPQPMQRTLRGRLAGPSARFHSAPVSPLLASRSMSPSTLSSATSCYSLPMDSPIQTSYYLPQRASPQLITDIRLSTPAIDPRFLNSEQTRHVVTQPYFHNSYIGRPQHDVVNSQQQQCYPILSPAMHAVSNLSQVPHDNCMQQPDQQMTPQNICGLSVGPSKDLFHCGNEETFGDLSPDSMAEWWDAMNDYQE